MRKERFFQKEKTPFPLVKAPFGLPPVSMSGPCDLDIGAGDGFHALARAAAFPNRQIIAIEKTRSRFQKLIRRIELQGRAPQRRASQRTGAAQQNFRPADFRQTGFRQQAGDGPQTFRQAPPAGDFPAEAFPAGARPASAGAWPPPNLWPLQTNAVWYLAHCGRKDMFENIFLLYPNPWPKRKQSNKRWINRPFTAYLLTLLKSGGRLEMRTDQEFYYREFREKILSFKGMRIEKDFIVPKGASPASAFERKYLHQGKICRVLCCRKSS